jgi:hypothetical protein
MIFWTRTLKLKSLRTYKSKHMLGAKSLTGRTGLTTAKTVAHHEHSPFGETIAQSGDLPDCRCDNKNDVRHRTTSILEFKFNMDVYYENHMF